MCKLVSTLKKYLTPSVVNGSKALEALMGKIQEIYPNHFARYRIRFISLQVEDVKNEHHQDEIIISTHKRAHKNGKENRAQILEKFCAGMNHKINRIVKQCTVYMENKCDRHPQKPELKKPQYQHVPGKFFILISMKISLS